MVMRSTDFARLQFEHRLLGVVDAADQLWDYERFVRGMAGCLS